MLQMNAYNVEHNRLDLDKEKRNLYLVSKVR